MNLLFDRDIKRMLRGAEGPAGSRAVIDVYRWLDNQSSLNRARNYLQQLGLPSDGSAVPRFKHEHHRDWQSLKVLQAKVSNEKFRGDLISTAAVGSPVMASFFSNREEVQKKLDAVVARLSTDWAVANIVALTEADHDLSDLARRSFSDASMPPDTTFEAFAERIADNAKFIGPALDARGLGH